MQLTMCGEALCCYSLERSGFREHVPFLSPGVMKLYVQNYISCKK